MNTAHTGLYIKNTKKRHVNIFTLVLPISQYTYLCPNSRNSATVDTGIEFYVSCQEFFFGYIILPCTMNTAHSGLYIKNTKKKTCEIAISYSYLSLSIHIYVLTHKTVPRCTRAQNSMSHVRIFFCIYHFSLHDEHGTYGFLHKQYKEKTSEYLYLFPIDLLAYIFMS